MFGVRWDRQAARRGACGVVFAGDAVTLRCALLDVIPGVRSRSCVTGK